MVFSKCVNFSNVLFRSKIINFKRFPECEQNIIREKVHQNFLHNKNKQTNKQNKSTKNKRKKPKIKKKLNFYNLFQC